MEFFCRLEFFIYPLFANVLTSSLATDMKDQVSITCCAKMLHQVICNYCDASDEETFCVYMIVGDVFIHHLVGNI